MTAGKDRPVSFLSAARPYLPRMALDLKPATFHPIAPEDRPQDPNMDGAGWTFTNLEHGGDYPDTMPQAIRATDAQGRSCVYVVLEVDGLIGEWR